MKKENKFIILVGKLYLSDYMLTMAKPEHQFINNIKFSSDRLLAIEYENIKSAISMKRIICEELRVDPKEVEICII